MYGNFLTIAQRRALAKEAAEHANRCGFSAALKMLPVGAADTVFGDHNRSPAATQLPFLEAHRAHCKPVHVHQSMHLCVTWHQDS